MPLCGNACNAEISIIVLCHTRILPAGRYEGMKMRPNYAFKPTAEQAVGMGRGTARRGGLTRRWISEAVAGRWRASCGDVDALER